MCQLPKQQRHTNELHGVSHDVLYAAAVMIASFIFVQINAVRMSCENLLVKAFTKPSELVSPYSQHTTEKETYCIVMASPKGYFSCL